MERESDKIPDFVSNSISEFSDNSKSSSIGHKGYCFSCQDHRDVVNSQEVLNKRNKPRVTGNCGTCQKKISTFPKRGKK